MKAGVSFIKKTSTLIALALILLMVLTACDSGAQKKDAGGCAGIDVASPDRAGSLDDAKDAQQMLVVAAFRVFYR